MEFNFKVAQEYEMRYSIEWMNKEYSSIMEVVKNARRDNSKVEIYLEEFFKGDMQLFNSFIEEMKDKTTMEVSSGPCGIYPYWGHYLTGRKCIIDPLIDRYSNYLKAKFGESWFENINNLVFLPYEVDAEIYDFVGDVDGFIFWRNGLDHLVDVQQALLNVSNFANSGCKLLFWSDIHHLEPVDEGHNQQIFRNPQHCEDTLMSYGWKIDYRTPSIRDAKKIIDYGCVATKI